MARTPTTPDQAAAKVAHHRAMATAALRTLSRPLADDVVCDCESGNPEGITPRECGCEYLEAAKALEAAGCYIRRAVERGLV